MIFVSLLQIQLFVSRLLTDGNLNLEIWPYRLVSAETVPYEVTFPLPKIRGIIEYAGIAWLGYLHSDSIY